ncbi:MAG: hypothetical protein WAM92_10535 [Mycobacterium sp.]
MTTLITLLADDGPRNTGPDFGKASPVGLLIIVLLLIGTFALIWSMNRHLKKLPKSFDQENPEPEAADDGTAAPHAEPTPDEQGTRDEPAG